MTLAIGARHQMLLDSPIDTIDKTAETPTAAIRDTASGASPATARVATGSVAVPGLSGAGNLLSNALAAAGTDDVRTDKVEALKAAIVNGSYTVPAAAVADKLIEHLLG